MMVPLTLFSSQNDGFTGNLYNINPLDAGAAVAITIDISENQSRLSD